MLALEGQAVLFTTKDIGFEHTGLEVVKLLPVADHVDLQQVMQFLAEREINEVHVEAGAELCGALLNEKLVDEVVVYMAPHLMGDEAKGLFALPQIETMKQRIQLNINDIRAVGKDWRITAQPEYLDR